MTMQRPPLGHRVSSTAARRSRGGKRRPADDEGEVAVAEVEQVLDGMGHAGAVVEAGRQGRHALGHVAIEQDDRQLARPQRLDDVGVVLLRQRQQQPVDLAVLEQRDVVGVEVGSPSELVSSSE